MHVAIRRYQMAGLTALACLFTVSAVWAQAPSTVQITGVTPVAAITVPDNTELTDALAALPRTTTITLSDGATAPVELRWSLRDLVRTSRGTNTVRQIWYPSARGPYQMVGDFALPAGVTQSSPSIPLQVIATVNIGSGPLLTIDDREAFRQPGRYVRETLRFNNINRTFNYYIPSSYDGSKPVPLMITLHGAGSYGLGQLNYTEFDRVAEEDGFIVVAPDYGLNAQGVFLTPNISIFSAAIIERMAASFNIDRRRVYASGISQGGAASIGLAYSLPNRIAAVAPVAAGVDTVLEQSLSRPTTFVIFYGTQDSNFGPEFLDGLDSLSRQNRTATNEILTLSTPRDPTNIKRHVNQGGVFGTEAIYYEVSEGGHTWPGKYQYASLISVGLTSQLFDATRVIWDHLKEHTLPASNPIDIRSDAIDPAGDEVTLVAVLSTAQLDATTVEVDTLRLGPAEARAQLRSFEDVNRDGLLDVMVEFRTQEIGIRSGDTSAMLTGRARRGGAFFGSDSFRTEAR